jgi:hypothetical protein
MSETSIKFHFNPTQHIWIEVNTITSEQGRTWVGLPEATERAVHWAYSTATESVLGDGWTTLFWIDQWIGAESIRSLAPAIFVVVPKRCLRRTVAEAVNQNAWVLDL